MNPASTSRNPLTRRGGVLLNAPEGSVENVTDEEVETTQPQRRVSVGIEDSPQPTDPFPIPEFNVRRPTICPNDAANKPTKSPAYKRVMNHDRRSSFGGVTHHHPSHFQAHGKTNNLEAEPKSRNRRYSVIRVKSETKLKPEVDKHTSEALTQQQIMAFKEAFDLFDNNGGGTIDALELKETLESVGIEIDESEIHDVMMRLDKDGNGEIDFEEFLDLMTNTEMFLEAFASRHDPSSESYKVRDRDVLLFDALTEFMKKSALKEAHEIVGYYAKKYKKVVKSYNANKGAHVVGHYADGARLIGLTEKQIVQQLKKLRLCQTFENKGEKESPYAQPLQLSVLRSVTSSATSKRRRRKKTPPKPPATAPGPPRRETSLLQHAPRHSQRLSMSPLANLRRQSSCSDTNVSLPPDPPMLNRPRKKRIVLKIINNELLQKEPKRGSSAKRRESDKKSKNQNRLKDEVQEHKPGWLSQRNKMYNVVITMPMRYRSVQVDRLPRLRKKVEEAKGKFCEEIARKKIQNNIRHYKELDSRRIPSPNLYEHFQRVFCAYSSAETNNRTAVSSEQLRKASQQNNFHRRTSAPSKYFYPTGNAKKK